ncbi:MAG: flagellar motor protein MotB [Fidelibacterota bacterium]
MISNSIKDVVGGKQPVEKKLSLQEIQQKVNELIVEENLQDEVDVRPSYRGVKVVSRGDITFESGKADLTSKIKPFLMKLAKIIREAPFPVAVEGHTDNVPIQSKKYPSNWELSSARASETVRFFIDLGVPKDRLRAIGFADTRPVDTNDTDEGRARNRRVEIIFLTAT